MPNRMRAEIENEAHEARRAVPEVADRRDPNAHEVLDQ